MVSKAQHTPTPWIAKTENKVIGSGKQTSIIASKITLANFTPHFPDAVQEANAAHIVKCVNLHDELVEALEKIAGGHVPAGFLNGIESESKESFQERMNVWAQGVAKDAVAKASNGEASNA